MRVPDPERMSLEQSIEHWKQARNEYDLAFSEFMATFPKIEGAVTEPHRKAIKRYWKSAAHLLREYSRVRLQYGHTLEPMPDLLFFRLARDLDDLGSGIMPVAFEKARDDGRAYSLFERELIAKAVYFLKAVEAGEIEHHAPTKTVAEKYNVTSQTVRNWKKKSDEYCHYVPRPHRNMLVPAMEDAGFKYSRLGRGAPSSHS